MTKQLILNIGTNGCTISNWKISSDNSRSLINNLDSWVEVAKLAERGKLHGIFIADHLSLFDAFKGPHNFKEPNRLGVLNARIDPSIIVSSLASVTKSLGFAITFSTISEHPYHLARRLSSLDHLTKGRLGWNIVNSYLESSSRQLLNGERFPEHDERYVKAQEYLDVVYGLLLSSWRDDAVKYDKLNGVFADPELIREINHIGDYFNVKGASISEPSPQRFPLVIQAGNSHRGQLFAAENGELIFVGAHDPSKIGPFVKSTRRLAREKFGRDGELLKFIIPANIILGETHEKALENFKQYEEKYDPEWSQVMFGGVSGIDLSLFELDDEVVPNGQVNAIQSTTENILKKKGSSGKKRDVLQNYYKNGFFGKLFIGTPEEVSVEIEEFVKETDIDGFNIGFSTIFPSSIKSLVDDLVPVLQEKGLFHTEYEVPGGTFRENIYGKGKVRLGEDHPAHSLIWTDDYNKAKFEQILQEVKTKIKQNRENSLKS